MSPQYDLDGFILPKADPVPRIDRKPPARQGPMPPIRAPQTGAKGQPAPNNSVLGSADLSATSNLLDGKNGWLLIGAGIFLFMMFMKK